MVAVTHLKLMNLRSTILAKQERSTQYRKTCGLRDKSLGTFAIEHPNLRDLTNIYLNIYTLNQVTMLTHYALSNINL